MSTMSRSARNRQAAKARRDQTVPRGVPAARPTLTDLHQNSRIRCVGYLGRNPTSVSYSGSGDDGYRSDWSGSMDFFTDPKWGQTVSSQMI